MPPPSLTRFAADLYHGLAPLTGAEEENGYPLAHYCAAIAKPHDSIDALSLDDGNRLGWSKVTNLDDCPDDWLPWLAQFQGVELTVGASPAQWREEIRGAQGQKRGTPASIVAAAKLSLTGNRTVVNRERDTSPWHFTLLTRTSETPDPARVIRDVNKVKPARLKWDLTVAAGLTWNEATGTWTAAGATSWDATVSTPV